MSLLGQSDSQPSSCKDALWRNAGRGGPLLRLTQRRYELTQGCPPPTPSDPLRSLPAAGRKGRSGVLKVKVASRRAFGVGSAEVGKI